MFNIESGSYYYCTNLKFNYLIRLIKPDCLCRTDDLTYFAFSFYIIGTVFPVDHRLIRNCLWKRHINSGTHTHTLLKFIGYLFLRAFGSTKSATGTQLFVYAFRFLPDLNLKVADEALNTFNFSITVKSN